MSKDFFSSKPTLLKRRTFEIILDTGGKNHTRMKLLGLFKRISQFCFYLLFLGFSYQSVVAFQLFLLNHNHLKFPDLTFCPQKNRSFSYLKKLSWKRISILALLMLNQPRFCLSWGKIWTVCPQFWKNTHSLLKNLYLALLSCKV